MLDVTSLHVHYPEAASSVRAVNNIDFQVEEGELFTLLGPSGCGKSTTLRAIAGLETPVGGSIRIDGETVYSSTTGRSQPSNRREIAMVFQSYAIWPHMTVFQNAAFPAQCAQLDADEARRRAMEALQLVDLEAYVDRPATDISGGQQQRVALARAIVKNAKLLLLDEPLSNLDAKLRFQMRRDLQMLQKRLGTTALYVTHDQEEALSMSDRIALMRSGRIVEIGEPERLYRFPRHPFTAKFLGQASLLPCKNCRANGETYVADTAFGTIHGHTAPDNPAHAVWMMVRPEHVEIVRSSEKCSDVVSASVSSVSFSGRFVEYEFETKSDSVKAVELSGAKPLRIGDIARLRLPPQHVVFLPSDSDKETENETETENAR